MNYIFFGSPRFAEVVLGILIDGGLPPRAVVCNPDRPVGRKKMVTPPLVKVLAEEHGVEVLQPETLQGQEEALSRYAAGCFVVAAYAKIIPATILAIPPRGTVGVHPSLLPKFRGATPIQSAILSGEKETGVSLYLLDDKVDHGPILAQTTLSVDDAGYEELEDRLARAGGELLLKILPRHMHNAVESKTQDESQATYTKKIATEDAFISETELTNAVNGIAAAAEAVLRKIRALNPGPGTWTMRDGKRMKILEAKLEGSALRLTKIQFEGKNPQTL